MAIFSNYIVENSDIQESVLPDIDLDALMMDESVEPAIEDNFLVAGARICAENTVNMNNIMEACAIQEFCYFEEHGTEMVYEGGALTGFIEKAKAFFLKMWEKIKSIFKKAAMMFSSKTKSDKEFLNKYKKELTQASNSSFGDLEVSMYDYVFYDSAQLFIDRKNDAVDPSKQFLGNDADSCIRSLQTKANVSNLADFINAVKDADDKDDAATKAAVEKADEAIKTVNESDWKEDYKDTIRGELVRMIDSKASDSISSSDFASDIAEAVQKDSSKENVAMSVALRKSMKFLEDSKNITAGLDKALKVWKKEIDNEIKSLNNVAKSLSRDIKKDSNNANRAKGYAHTCVSTCIALDKDVKNIGIAFHSALITHLKNCSGQSKAICVKAVNYKKPKNESYAYTEESTGSLLDSIELI